MRDRLAPQFLLGSLLLGGLLSTACSSGSSGSGSGSSGAAGFQLVRISLLEGSVWEVNREIEFTFSAAVDFSSVSLNTVNIQSSTGAPAMGSFFMKMLDTDGDGQPDTTDPTAFIFQPNCPTLEDLSDSGLQAGGVSYTLTVVGRSSGAVNTVRSMNGANLEATQTRRFSTPASTDPANAFLDTTLGPPVPVVRSVGSSVTDATYLELGGDSTNRTYFEFNEVTQMLELPPGFTVPLNLYADGASRTAVIIEFNQPVNPSSTNISSSRLRLEFRDATGAWRTIDTRVELIANCTQVGARVRLEPVGILPDDSEFRAVVLPGFQDLVGQTNLLAIDDFAVAPTESIQFTSLTPQDTESDEFQEPFNVGGDGPDSFQDTTALFDSPAAEWNNGLLRAAFTFRGTGGPGGDFDWVVRDGEIFFFDTTAQTVVGGPGGVPTTQQNATNGVVDVRNLTIEEGGEIRVQGPNPFVIVASGDVRINGKLDFSGFNAKDVATLNTGNQAEIGGAGSSGGGKGGDASQNLTNSTPRGGGGQGPFLQPNTGGQGGESGFAPTGMGKDARRPGGGGGGRFGIDDCDPAFDFDCLANQGRFSEAGFDGHANARGAISGVSPPAGGSPGLGPFIDGDSSNDHFGVRPVVNGMGDLVGLIEGELPSVWGGYGGGGGGDAVPSNSFPQNNWGPGSDEKGGGGGGASGALNIRTLGRIIFGPAGLIIGAGGRGGTGENTIFLDHIGGTGGSASGGHVVLESATQIDFTDEGNNLTADTSIQDWIRSVGGGRKIGPSTSGGAVSFGGSGGPGVVQLHVPDPITPPGTDLMTTDIVVPISATLLPEPLSDVTTPTAFAMIPTFGARSQARSRWISIGGADQNPGGGVDLLRFLFEGTDQTPGPDQGKILSTGGTVDELMPVLGPETITGNVGVDPDGFTLAISGASLDPLINDASPISDDIYLRTPDLLRSFILRLNIIGNPSSAKDFVVSSAVYDDAGVVLRVTVTDDQLGNLQDYLNLAGGPVEYVLVPRFFRLITGGVPDALPASAFVRIEFQATGANTFGAADEDNILIDFTGDISEFNALNPGDIQFFRFEVEFDLDAAGAGVSVDTQQVVMDFLRIPFTF